MPVQVAFDERVLAYITAELKRSPNVEEGGKYAGYLLPMDAPQLRAFDLDREQAAFVVTDLSLRRSRAEWGWPPTRFVQRTC